MTTRNSPVRVLKAQADKIAKALKDPNTPQVKAARLKPTFKTGIVMDDKTITLEMPWTLVDATSEEALAAMILREMQEAGNGH